VAISTKVSPELEAIITMTAQETTSLPYRLARSANDLAWASLSGVACELKNPQMAKQVGSSSRTATARQHGDAAYSSEFPRSRPLLHSRENSFRNQPNALASRAIEEEFVRFRETDSSPTAWPSSDLTASAKIILGSTNYGEDSYGIRNEPQATHCYTSGATDENRANDAINSEISQSGASIVNESKSASKADHARAAAARRLEQIGAQIQRNLAMQMLHQNASMQNHLSPTAAMDLQYESATQQAANQQSNTPQSSHFQSTDDSNRMLHHAHHHHHQTPASSPSEVEKDEQDDSQIDFHCPYYACHQNLQRLLMGSGQKSCVHMGCSERPETRKAWNEHIALPHHDLQG
jgi:hypothetical protein